MLIGDTFIELDFQKIEKHWKRRKNNIIVGRKVKEMINYGSIEVVNHKVIKFLEKKQTGSGYVNTGCYVFNQGILNHFSYDLPFSIEKDFFQKENDNFKFDFILSNGFFIDIGTTSDYQRANKNFKIINNILES